MPAGRGDQENWFEPYIGKVDPHLRDRYQKVAKNLKRGLVFGNPHSVIGLLCACFDFALNDKGLRFQMAGSVAMMLEEASGNTSQAVVAAKKVLRPEQWELLPQAIRDRPGTQTSSAENEP